MKRSQLDPRGPQFKRQRLDCEASSGSLGGGIFFYLIEMFLYSYSGMATMLIKNWLTLFKYARNTTFIINAVAKVETEALKQKGLKVHWGGEFKTGSLLEFQDALIIAYGADILNKQVAFLRDKSTISNVGFTNLSNYFKVDFLFSNPIPGRNLGSFEMHGEFEDKDMFNLHERA
jgi:hypothetical protein